MNRSLFYSLFLVFAALAVFGVSQGNEDGAPEGSVVAAAEQNDVAEGEAGEPLAEPQEVQGDVQQDQAAPDALSRMVTKRSLTGKGGPVKKRPAWVIPVAVIGGLALAAGVGVGGMFAYKKFKGSGDEKKLTDEEKKKAEEEKKKKEEEEKKKKEKDGGTPTSSTPETTSESDSSPPVTAPPASQGEQPPVTAVTSDQSTDGSSAPPTSAAPATSSSAPQ